MNEIARVVSVGLADVPFAGLKQIGPTVSKITRVEFSYFTEFRDARRRSLKEYF